ncbi:MAG: hypothetical protein IPP37_04570 [Saprospiraceae bacterium]|nr:hypothetical protein [Saprospiraceae bacterium]
MIKYISNRIILILILVLSGHVNSECQVLNSGIKDFIGLETIYKEDIEIEIQKIVDNFRINNSNIVIRLEKVYPVSSYLKETDGLNAMISLSHQQIASYDSSFIIFYLIHDSKSNEIKLEYFHRIFNLNFQDECSSSLATLVGGILGSMKDMHSSINEAESAIKSSLIRINESLDSGCGYDFGLTRSYLEKNGFDIISLKDFDVELGQSYRNIKTDQRDGICHLVQYSPISVEQKPITDYLNSSEFSQLESRVVLLSRNDLNEELKLESVLETELGLGAEGLENNDCDVTFVIFFLGKDENGDDYLGIGMKINDDPASFEYLSLEEYKDKIDNYQFENLETFKRISFRSHDLVKNNLRSMEVYLIEYATINELNFLSAEWFAGLASGVIDGFIELIDVGAILLQAAWGYESSILNLASSPTSSVAFLADLCYFRLKANSFKDAFKLKFNHDLNVTLTVDKFIDNISKITLDQIFDSVAKMLKDTLKKMLFLEGVFEQGYTIGKLVFEYIGAVFTGATSTLSNALMRAKNLDEILAVFIKEGKDAIAKILKKSYDD